MNSENSHMKDLFKDGLQKKYNDHDGLNHIFANRVYTYNPLKKIDFIEVVIVPKGSTIGRHVHGNNEETYIILEGEGDMLFCNNRIKVEKGMILKNPLFSEHSLENNSDRDLLLLVFEESDLRDC